MALRWPGTSDPSGILVTRCRSCFPSLALTKPQGRSWGRAAQRGLVVPPRPGVIGAGGDSGTRTSVRGKGEPAECGGAQGPGGSPKPFCRLWAWGWEVPVLGLSQHPKTLQLGLGVERGGGSAAERPWGLPAPGWAPQDAKATPAGPLKRPLWAREPPQDPHSWTRLLPQEPRPRSRDPLTAQQVPAEPGGCRQRAPRSYLRFLALAPEELPALGLRLWLGLWLGLWLCLGLGLGLSRAGPARARGSAASRRLHPAAAASTWGPGRATPRHVYWSAGSGGVASGRTPASPLVRSGTGRGPG